VKKLFVVVSIASIVLPALAGQAGGKDDSQVPAYMSDAQASKKLPKTLPPSQFSDPQTARAYTVAKEIPKVLAQQPCYCWCSRGGHRGLLDCYVSDHAAHCGVCQKEALFAAKLTKQGKSPAEIRTAIEKSGWVNAE
jgi:hypothetical protein